MANRNSVFTHEFHGASFHHAKLPEGIWYCHKVVPPSYSFVYKPYQYRYIMNYHDISTKSTIVMEVMFTNLAIYLTEAPPCRVCWCLHGLKFRALAIQLHQVLRFPAASRSRPLWTCAPSPGSGESQWTIWEASGASFSHLTIFFFWKQNKSRYGTSICVGW